jgi:hypothetical protein
LFKLSLFYEEVNAHLQYLRNGCCESGVDSEEL